MGSPTSGPGAWRLADNTPRPLIMYSDVDEAAKIRQQIEWDFDCSYGTYVMGENSIRVRVSRVHVDTGRRTLHKAIPIGAGSEEVEHAYPFRKVKGMDVVEIDGVTLMRQDDLTGRTLEAANIKYIVLNITAQSRMVQGWFRPDGTFLLQRFGSGSMLGDNFVKRYGVRPMPPNGSESSGRYEIRGHEILFTHPGNQPEHNLFGHVGKDAAGKEIVVIGNNLCPVDRIR